jgi:hypothetical protein
MLDPVLGDAYGSATKALPTPQDSDVLASLAAEPTEEAKRLKLREMLRDAHRREGEREMAEALGTVVILPETETDPLSPAVVIPAATEAARLYILREYPSDTAAQQRRGELAYEVGVLRARYEEVYRALESLRRRARQCEGFVELWGQP